MSRWPAQAWGALAPPCSFGAWPLALNEELHPHSAAVSVVRRSPTTPGAGPGPRHPAAAAEVASRGKLSALLGCGYLFL